MMIKRTSSKRKHYKYCNTVFCFLELVKLLNRDEVVQGGPFFSELVIQSFWIYIISQLANNKQLNTYVMCVIISAYVIISAKLSYDFDMRDANRRGSSL